VALVASERLTLQRIARALVPERGLRVLLHPSPRDMRTADVVVAAVNPQMEQLPPDLRSPAGAANFLIVVSSSFSTRAVREALVAGASAVVLEDDVGTALGPVIRAAVLGYTSIPDSRREAVVRPELSHRERQVLRLAALGRTNAEIASELCLAESTVKTHLSAAFKQIGVRSRRQAAALVLDPDEGLYPLVFGPTPP
jgi:DNA-binding NarL/FixJ family response regulator